MPNPLQWRDFALELADAADRLALRHFGRTVGVATKSDGSPVTAADREIEAALRERIAEAYPDHAVMGEEEGGGVVADRPTWVLDPLDGTANFVRGIPVFATLIGVLEHGEAVTGVVSAPALGERWDAARGHGARQNGQRVAVSDIERLEDAQVLHGGTRHLREEALWRAFETVTDRAWRTRGFGDFWMHLLVAGGMAEAAFERGPKIWDVAALACIVTESGGTMTRFDGGSVLDNPAGEILTTNGALQAELLTLLTRA